MIRFKVFEAGLKALFETSNKVQFLLPSFKATSFSNVCLDLAWIQVDLVSDLFTFTKAARRS